jgi:hypothetical protein
MSRNDPVWMRNDVLDVTRRFVRSQVPYMGAAGWREVDPPPEPEPEPEDAGTTGEAVSAAAQTDSKPSRRTRPRPSSEGKES